MGDDDDDLTEAEEDAWCVDQRATVVKYLGMQDGLNHGEVGEWPAWHMAPYVSLWAVESLRAPGSVGWWVICGDLPCDYCASAPDCNNPRRALRRLAESWQTALAQTPSGAATIGATGLPVHLGDLLRSRARFLLEMVADDAIWPPDAPDSDSSTTLH
jgi:hypothetical protein